MALFLTLISILLINTQAILTNAESFTVHQNSGIFTDTITADPYPNTDPSKYGICGFSLREMIYTKKTYDCGCRVNCYGKRICNWCDTEFRLKTNAIKITFCELNQPTNKLTKIFESGNNKSGKWRDTICSQGMVVERYAARFGNDDGINIGLNGFQLQCVTPHSDKKATVMDNYTFPLSATSNNSVGTAAIGASIKYDQGGMLTGIKVYFQPYNMVISEVEIAYRLYTLVGSPKIKTIETVIYSNTQITARNVEQKFTIPYVSSSIFTNDQTNFNQFRMESSVIMQAPALNPADTEQSVFYMKIFSNPSFERNVTVTYQPYKTTTISLPWCTQVVGVSQVVEQMAKVPYTIKFTFINSASREIVKRETVTGNWEGLLSAPITTTTTYSLIPGCKDD